MDALSSLLEERSAILNTVEVADQSLKTLNQKIRATAFPQGELDTPRVVDTSDGTFEMMISSRLEWDQEVLAMLVPDAECGQYIKEKLSVDKKDFESMPTELADKFAPAVTRKTGLFKIKKL